MKNSTLEYKIDMIKSQLKQFEIFQDSSKIYIKIPSTIDIENLSYTGENIMFYTVDEIENSNTISCDTTMLECDIYKINPKELLFLITELNKLQRMKCEI